MPHGASGAHAAEVTLETFLCLAAGQVFVAPNASDTRDRLHHDDNAALVPPHDDAAFAAALEQVVAHGARMQWIVEHAPATAVEPARKAATSSKVGPAGNTSPGRCRESTATDMQLAAECAQHGPCANSRAGHSTVHRLPDQPEPLTPRGRISPRFQRVALRHGACSVPR